MENSEHCKTQCINKVTNSRWGRRIHSIWNWCSHARAPNSSFRKYSWHMKQIISFSTKTCGKNAKKPKRTHSSSVFFFLICRIMCVWVSNFEILYYGKCCSLLHSCVQFYIFRSHRNYFSLQASFTKRIYRFTLNAHDLASSEWKQEWNQIGVLLSPIFQKKKKWFA